MKSNTKKMIARLLAAAVCMAVLNMSVLPVLADGSPTIPNRIQMIFNSPVFYDDLNELIEAVEANNAADIFMTVLKIYPDFVAMAKKSATGNVDSGTSASSGYYAKVINYVKKDPVIFDAMARLCETVDGNDAAQIFECIMEIYPDFIGSIKRGLAEHPPKKDSETEASSSPESELLTGTVLGSKNTGTDNRLFFYLLTGIGGFLLGSGVTYGFLRKRKKKA